MSWVRPPHWPGILSLTTWITPTAIYSDSYSPSPVAKPTRRQGFCAALTSTIQQISVEKHLVPPGLEPGTFRVLSERDNHYTMELCSSADVLHV